MVDQQGWKAICTRFYLDNDPVAKSAVGLFEKSQATATATAVQSAEYTALEVGERDDGNRAAYSLLSGVGLSTPTSLSPEDLLSCVKTKNAARSEAHVVVRT